MEELELKESSLEELEKLNLIAFYESQLRDSDYIVVKCFEEIMALDNKLTFIVDVITILMKYSKEYKENIKHRVELRQLINNLKGE